MWKWKEILYMERYEKMIQESDFRRDAETQSWLCEERSWTLRRVLYARSGNAVEAKFYQNLPLSLILHAKANHLNANSVR